MKTRLRILIVLAAISINIGISYAQTYHQVSLGFNNSKDGINNGILFKGIQVGYKFGIQKKIHSSVLNYMVDVELGALKGKGILGVDMKLKPVSLSYGLSLYRDNRFEALLGPKFEADYRLQLYPDLQMGNIMWMTNYALSPQVDCIHKLTNGDAIRLRADYALIALTSRTEHLEPYFFSLRFADIISDMQSNMSIAFTSKLAKTDIGIDYLFSGVKRDYAIGYEFNYLGYRKTSIYKELNHAITFKIIRK